MSVNECLILYEYSWLDVKFVPKKSFMDRSLKGYRYEHF